MNIRSILKKGESEELYNIYQDNKKGNLYILKLIKTIFNNNIV